MNWYNLKISAIYGKKFPWSSLFFPVKLKMVTQQLSCYVINIIIDNFYLKYINLIYNKKIIYN